MQILSDWLVLKETSQFDTIYAEVMLLDLEDQFLAYLEREYGLIDIDKARDQAREGRL